MTTVLWSVISSALGIGALGLLGGVAPWFSDAAGPLVIGAFGASAVLLYGAPNSPLAQPYNVLVGHLVSAVIGVAAYRAVGVCNALSMAAGVSLAIGAMQLTRSVHPPGGATALIAVIGGERIHTLGFHYVLSPVMVGAVVLVAVAYVTNRLYGEGRWPLFWLPYSFSGLAFAKKRTQEP